MTKIVTVAHIPDGLEHEWLQYLRDFDLAHQGCHFEVLADTPQSVDDIVKVLQRVDPGFNITTIKK